MFGKRQIPTVGGKLVEAEEKVSLWPLKLAGENCYTASDLLPCVVLSRADLDHYITCRGVVDGKQETLFGRRGGGVWYVLGWGKS